VLVYRYTHCPHDFRALYEAGVKKIPGFRPGIQGKKFVEGNYFFGFVLL
jgi:hypothetical protein